MYDYEYESKPKKYNWVKWLTIGVMGLGLSYCTASSSYDETSRKCIDTVSALHKEITSEQIIACRVNKQVTVYTQK